MERIILILSLFLLSSCSVETRIKDHSYTKEWYYEGSTRYQVYQTRLGKKYILVVNKKQNGLKRKYL
jgi:hypothetical protein